MITTVTTGIGSYGYASTPECFLSAEISYLVIAELQRNLCCKIWCMENRKVRIYEMCTLQRSTPWASMAVLAVLHFLPSHLYPLITWFSHHTNHTTTTPAPCKVQPLQWLTICSRGGWGHTLCCCQQSNQSWPVQNSHCCLTLSYV